MLITQKWITVVEKC